MIDPDPTTCGEKNMRNVNIGEMIVQLFEKIKLGFIVEVFRNFKLRFAKGLRITLDGILHDDTQVQLVRDSRNDYLQVFGIIIGTTVLTYFLALIATAIQQNTFPGRFFDVWSQYDTNHYVNIAKMWYGTGEDQRVLIVFFPLYPALIKLFYFVFNDYLVSALFIANVAYVFAALYLYKLVRIDYSKEVSLRAVFYFSIFPTAFYMHAAYTESLFIALAVMSFYFARKGKWLRAAIFAGFLTGTRITGIFVIPALFFEYLQQQSWRVGWKNNWKYGLRAISKGLKPDSEFGIKHFGVGLRLISKGINTFWKKYRMLIVTMLVSMVGIGTYLAINIIVNGNPLSFLGPQKEVWNKTIATPWDGFLGAIGWFGFAKPEQFVIVGWGETLAGAGGLFIILWLIVKYRPMYAIFSACSWLLMTATEFWLSLPRYTLAIFPIFIIFSKWGKNKVVDYLLTFIFIFLFAEFMAHFTQARWTY
jgi:hypothetical protein